MRLRQKLFAAILAVMVVVFLLLALVSFLNGLEAQRTERSLREGMRDGVVASFVHAANDPGPEAWALFRRVMTGFAIDWCVKRADGGGVVCDPYGVHAEGSRSGRKPVHHLAKAHAHGGFELLLPPRPAEFGALAGLSGLFWAAATGTAFLLLVAYGLVLRLVLRPVEDLVAASRVLSSGKHPARVAGEWRRDEMGELIGAFNTMAAEVVSSREELQRRVEEATREYEKAQRRLVLEQRLAATGKLAAGIAHEINNPLGGMINAARTLTEKEDALSERGREYLGLIQDGLGRIGKIVDRMREFVKPRPSVGPVDLAETVRGALAFVRHRVDAEGVKVGEKIPSEPVSVTGDAGELQQVLLNLIVNALDAMSASEKRELTLGLASVGEGAGGEAVVTVADTGAGMDPERLASAFDLFYSTKGEGGTGLGLGIAHKIVADHGGAIELESSPGEGTTARLRLPLSAGNDSLRDDGGDRA